MCCVGGCVGKDNFELSRAGICNLHFFSDQIQMLVFWLPTDTNTDIGISNKLGINALYLKWLLPFPLTEV